MAYTYNDFLTAANTAGLTERFSQSDLAAAQKNPEYGVSMISLMQDIDNATTTEQQLLATEAANQLRKNYGVYGVGDDSSGYSYAGSYGSAINDLTERLNNYGSFDYDYSTDPSYSAYKKAYLREGERASANALAQASAASGGRTSSYAQTAAQQAANYYSGQLADIIPTLEQSAYEKYLDDYNRLQSSLDNYQTQDDTDYQRYLNAYAQMYQAEQDAQTRKQQEYENALALYELLGYATPEIAEILGINASTAGGASGGGSGSGKTTANDATIATPSALNGTGTLAVDTKSVIDLGYGPISEETLDKLVSSGAVEEYTEGNTLKFRNVTSGTNNILAANNFSGTKNTNTASSAYAARKAGTYVDALLGRYGG